MGLEYRLVPPFLTVGHCSSFPDAWEYFCCKLLNLENGTSRIHVRSPPEQGVDLFDEASRTAYQCKSVESGKPGDFHPEHVTESYRAAEKHQASIGWQEYALCTNVDITGTSLARLKRAIPNIVVLPRSYWQGLCEKFPSAVESNFRQLIEISSRSTKRSMKAADIEDVFGPHNPPAGATVFKILLYSQGYDAVYELPVHAEMTASTLVGLLMGLFRLPNEEQFCTEDVSVSLAHYINFEGKWLTDGTMESAGIGPGSLITYSTEVRWVDHRTPFREQVQAQQMQEQEEQVQGFQEPDKPWQVYALEHEVEDALARTASSLKRT